MVTENLYSPTVSPEAKQALQLLKRNLTYQRFQSAHDGSMECICPQEISRLANTLGLYSMRSHFSNELLTQFYSELMEPNFPRDELDELDDWIYALKDMDCSEIGEMENGPFMDVILLAASKGSSTGIGEDVAETSNKTILAGVVFEFYPNANVGLISYLVVASSYRKMGIMKVIHPLAIQALKSLGIL